MIWVCEPLLEEEELENIIQCIRSNMISGSAGEFIREFEEKFARYCGCKYGVATTSGTTALHLALASLEIKSGDEVITTTFTNAATVFSIIYCNATPILMDIEPDTWNMNVHEIEKKITDKTRAILPVHIYGHPVDMDPIMEVAEKYGLYVIEDAAEAHGAEYKGRKVGGIGHIGCFSFYANKIITTGEGGMIVTNDEEIAEKAKLLRNLAFSKEKRFLHEYIGFNYRMTNLQAAVGVAQLKKLDKFVERKREIARLYNSLLSEIDGITLPVEKKWAKNVYWMYGILVEPEFGVSRDELMMELWKKGIETRTFFIPMHEQPALNKMGLFIGEKYPVAEEISRKGLYLPSGVGLKKEDVEYVANTIKKIKERVS